MEHKRRQNDHFSLAGMGLKKSQPKSDKRVILFLKLLLPSVGHRFILTNNVVQLNRRIIERNSLSHLNIIRPKLPPKKSRLSGNTPHGEERSKESKSESGDFGHDLFCPLAHRYFHFEYRLFIIIRQLANRRSSLHIHLK